MCMYLMFYLGWLYIWRYSVKYNVRNTSSAKMTTSFWGDWSWNIFKAFLHPSADSRRVVVSYKLKHVHKVLVNCLFNSAQEKSVVRWTCRFSAIVFYLPLHEFWEKSVWKFYHPDFWCLIYHRPLNHTRGLKYIHTVWMTLVWRNFYSNMEFTGIL